MDDNTVERAIALQVDIDRARLNNDLKALFKAKDEQQPLFDKMSNDEFRRFLDG